MGRNEWTTAVRNKPCPAWISPEWMEEWEEKTQEGRGKLRSDSYGKRSCDWWQNSGSAEERFEPQKEKTKTSNGHGLHKERGENPFFRFLLLQHQPTRCFIYAKHWFIRSSWAYGIGLDKIKERTGMCSLSLSFTQFIFNLTFCGWKDSISGSRTNRGKMWGETAEKDSQGKICC